MAQRASTAWGDLGGKAPTNFVGIRATLRQFSEWKAAATTMAMCSICSSFGQGHVRGSAIAAIGGYIYRP